MAEVLVDSAGDVFDAENFVDASAMPLSKSSTGMNSLSTDSVLKELRNARSLLDENLTCLVRAKREETGTVAGSSVEFIRNRVTTVQNREEYLELIVGTLPKKKEGDRPPLCIPWRWLFNKIHGNARTIDKAALAGMDGQVRKDIERDVLRINGVEIAGSIGYDNIWLALQTTLRGLDPTLKEKELLNYSADILRFVSRTQSTGAAYEGLNYLFACPSVCLFSPDSTFTLPLAVDVGVGRWGQDWGLGVHIRAESVYKVIGADISADADENSSVWFRVKVVYEQKHSLKAIDMNQSRAYNAAQLRANIYFAQFEPPEEGSLREGAKDEESDSEGDGENEDDEDANMTETQANPLFRFAGLALADMTAGTVGNDGRNDVSELQDTINELYSFGRNESGMLGVPDIRGRLHPTPINFSGIVELTRVSKVACSWYHTVALTDVGLMYSWGDGSDGALGHGDRRNVLQPRLVEWFTEQTVRPGEIEGDEDIDKISVGKAMTERGLDPILLIDVAVGSDKIGAHTVACSTKGKVYSWGIAGATGHRITQSTVTPKLVNHKNMNRSRIKQVAAGGSFSLALSIKGAVFSWGKWANGRLGHGYLPAAAQQTHRSLARRQVPRFLLFPKRVDHLKGTRVKFVAAGEGHAMAIDSDGVLYTWGLGRNGQLGLGETGDQLAPTPVVEWQSKSGGAVRKDDVVVCHAAAGCTHSLAVTEEGNVYAWGANGGACLGTPADHYGDSAVIRSSGALVRASRVVEDRDGEIPTWLSEESTWLRPQLVTGLADPSKVVIEVSAGVEHSTAVTSTGDCYIWGGGLDTKIDLFADDVHKAPPKPLGVLGDGKLRSLETTPRLVAAQTEDCISQRRVRTAACGGWHTLIVTQGLHLGDQFRPAMKAGSGQKRRIGYYGSDVVISVVGKQFFAHKAILGNRSEKFKEMIEDEEQAAADAASADRAMTAALTGDTSVEPPVSMNDIGAIELMMSEMQPSLAQRLLEFLYTDTIRGRLDPTSNEVKDLLVLSEEYKLPRLKSICESAMSGESGALQTNADGLVLRVKPTSPCDLGISLSGMVGNQRWADVCFVVEGQRVYAHAVVLMSASSYFESMLLPMFSPADREGASGQQFDKYKIKEGMIDIEVPDSYKIFLPILIFCYTGSVLPTSSWPRRGSANAMGKGGEKVSPTSGWDPVDLVGLLVAAKRYNLSRLVTLCESLCVPDIDSCVTILKETARVQSKRLMDETLSFIAKNLDRLKDRPEFEDLLASSPHTLELLLGRVQAITKSKEWGVDRQAAARKIIEEGVLQELAEQKEREEEQGFPFFALGMLVGGVSILFGVVYRLPDDYMWIIPFLNIFMLVGATVVTGRVLAS
jgi:alpha-tubulin suppressor-like RCC1 family protein